MSKAEATALREQWWTLMDSVGGVEGLTPEERRQYARDMAYVYGSLYGRTVWQRRERERRRIASQGGNGGW